MKMTKFSLVSIVTFTVFFPGIAQALAYDFLAPLPGFGSTDLIAYLISMVKFLIGIAGVLAVIRLVVCGFELLASAVASKREHAKDCLLKVVLGLLLILSAYVLLESINPELNKPKLDLPETGQVEGVPGVRTPPTNPGWYFSNKAGKTGNEVYSTSYKDKATCDAAYSAKQAEPATMIKACYQVVAPAAGCPTCVSLAPDINAKPVGQGCLSPGPCQIGAEMKGKLVALRAAIGGTWWVTESYPPTRKHKDPCHEAGTCVDADYMDNRTGAADIINFLNAAKASGLRAVYEVDSAAEYSALLKAGVPATSLWNGSGWINGDHFSVYNN